MLLFARSDRGADALLERQSKDLPGPRESSTTPPLPSPELLQLLNS
jgi:hypothetical protein